MCTVGTRLGTECRVQLLEDFASGDKIAGSVEEVRMRFYW